MATGKCGTATIEYVDGCEYGCWCSKRGGCVWWLKCPGPDGTDGWISGAGFVQPDPSGSDRPTHIAFDGPAPAFVAFIEEHSGRKVPLPKESAGRRITIDVRGGVPAALRAAGLPAQKADRRTAARS